MFLSVRGGVLGKTSAGTRTRIRRVMPSLRLVVMLGSMWSTMRLEMRLWRSC